MTAATSVAVDDAEIVVGMTVAVSDELLLLPADDDVWFALLTVVDVVPCVSEFTCCCCCCGASICMGSGLVVASSASALSCFVCLPVEEEEEEDVDEEEDCVSVLLFSVVLLGVSDRLLAALS